MSTINTTTATRYYEAVAEQAEDATEDAIRVAFGLVPTPEGVDATTEPNAAEIYTVRELLKGKTPGERDNSQRALRALPALQGYAEKGFDVCEDVDMAHQALGDLLGDLRHLADRLGVDFTAANDRGFRHYTGELDEDEKGGWPFYLQSIDDEVDERCKFCGSEHAGPAPEFCAQAQAEYDRTGRLIEEIMPTGDRIARYAAELLDPDFDPAEIAEGGQA